MQENSMEDYDITLLPHSCLGDISKEALAEYRKARKAVRSSAPELGWSDEELLIALHAIAKDKEGVFRLTVAGLMLFGSQMALRRLRPMDKVDYIRVSGRQWVEDPKNRFESTLEIRDCLFNAIHRSLNAVLDDLPVSFALEEGEAQRKEKPLIPMQVLREGIVNALMHRKYSKASPVQIIRYSDRIEIYNIGYSLKPEDQLEETGSVPRNPNLAAVLLETGFAENKGSGIRLMRQMMQEAGLKMPVFKSDREGDCFKATYYFQHFLSKEAVGWLKRFSAFHLTEDQVRTLIHVKNHGEINNAAYRELHKVDTVQASTALRRLCTLRILSSKGKGRHSYYLLNSQYVENSALSSEFNGLPSESSALSSESNSLPSESNSLPSESSTLPSESNALSSQLPNQLDALPDSLKREIEELGQRAAPERVREIILALCAYKPFKASELGKILGRNMEYLKTRHLVPALKAGDVIHTIPERPNHPQQAYTVPKKR